jgi:hypothetical protein
MLHRDYHRKSLVEKQISGRWSQEAWRQDELTGSKSPVVIYFFISRSRQSSAGRQIVEGCSCEKWEAGSRSRGKFDNPEEEERPLLEAAI